MAIDITLITATGDRPWAFSLCEKYVARQTKQDFHWIVVDDGKEPTQVTMGQQYIRLNPTDTVEASFRRNLLTGLSAASTKRILFWEDDDWYSPWYVEEMSAMFDKAKIVGQGRCKYYHVRSGQYKIHPNTAHASLAQTGISGNVIPIAKRYLETHPRPQQLDGALWKRSMIPEHDKFLLGASTLLVSMKGVPGRGGLGIDHIPEKLDTGYRVDEDGSMLKRWLGDDAEPYLGLRTR